MSSVLFKINNVDYTNNIVVDTYEVNAVEVNDKYTDASETDHYIYLRKRIKGKFDMAFASQADYTSFISNYNSGKSSAKNAWQITVIPNNTLTSSQIYARVTFEPTRTITVARTDIIRQITVNIEEL